MSKKVHMLCHRMSRQFREHDCLRDVPPYCWIEIGHRGPSRQRRCPAQPFWLRSRETNGSVKRPMPSCFAMPIIASRNSIAWMRAKVQHNTLMKLVAPCQEHAVRHRPRLFPDLFRGDYQARVPIRDYEWFWNNYWKDVYPNLDNVTWPGKNSLLRAVIGHDERGDQIHSRVLGDGEIEQERRPSRRIALFRHANPSCETLHRKVLLPGRLHRSAKTTGWQPGRRPERHRRHGSSGVPARPTCSHRFL